MKNEACIAWSWFCVTVEMVKPIARLTVMNSAVPRQNSARLPSIADVEQEPRHQQDHRDLHRADGDVGRDLADHHLDRPHRHGQQVLHRAALALARHGERRHHHHGHGEDHRQQARHDVEPRLALGIVAALQHHLDGARLACAARRAGRRGRAAAPARWPAPPAASGLAAAIGSVASASIRIWARSPRTSRRVKSEGMVTTNCTSPCCSRALASASDAGPMREVACSRCWRARRGWCG